MLLFCPGDPDLSMIPARLSFILVILFNMAMVIKGLSVPDIELRDTNGAPQCSNDDFESGQSLHVKNAIALSI